MLRKTYTICLLGLTGIILMAFPVRAQTAGGSFGLSAVLNGGNVDLSWQQPSNFTVSYYLVYKAEVGIVPPNSLPAQINWTQIDSTTDTNYVDTTAPAKDTAFAYIVKGFKPSVGVLSSNMAIVFVNPISYHKDHVTITSTPSLNATVDSLYTYQVTAVSDSPSAVLHYSLGQHPDSMTISSTGLITWTPKLGGYREIEVVVNSSLGGEARQDYTVRVARIDATISGLVTDTLSHALPHVMIHLYGTAMPLVIVGGGPLPVGFFGYQAETDSTGHYSITHLDGGKYFVQAVPLNPNYLPEWYNNVQNLKDATPIAVTKDSAYTANFTLKSRFYQLPKFTVSGNVTDTNGVAVKGALVVFTRTGFVFNEAKEDLNEWMSDENFRDFFEDAIHDKAVDHRFDLDDIHSPYVFGTYADSNGVYKDTLPEGDYIGIAEAKGYYRVFYNNESNLLSADILKLTGDTTGINFKLIPVPPVVLGQINGSVLDSTSSAGVPARMIAFRDVWDYRDTLKMHVAGAYFVDADTTGAYTFTNLPPGYYKILALPLGGYAPSFYSLTGPTVRWKEATAVQIDGNSVSGINIYVMPIPDSVSGYSSISGAVTSSGPSGSVTVSSVTGVSGAIVYATDADGNVEGYGVTDGSGNYTITGLTQGTFNVFTDAFGYTSSGSASSSTTYNSDGTATAGSASLSVTPESPLAVKTPSAVQPTSYSLEQNYPNPFNPTTQIAFNIAQTERVDISIFNILGQKVATVVDGEMGSGAHIVMWNGRNQNGELLPSGVYFYRLSTPNFTAVKKMLLLK